MKPKKSKRRADDDSIEVEITVVAVDRGRRVKSTREDVVRVPGKVIKLFEVLGGDEDEVLRRIGDTVFASAMRELQGGRTDLGRVLMEAGGGRIGGRGQGNRAPVAEESGLPAASKPRSGGGDQLTSMLGLDIIQAGVKRDRTSRAASAPAPGQTGPRPRPMSPGPIGFPRG